jgi:hypothetical protein
MKTALLAATLIAFGAPAFASSEAPVTGSATVLTAPAFTTAGSDGAPMFLPATPDMRIANGRMPGVALSAETYPGKRS